MKFINLRINMPLSEVLEYVSDSNAVNDKVRFDEKAGKPFMHVKEKGGRLTITCEMMDRPSKDNGFVFGTGTFFSGKIGEENGETYIKGKIMTAPIYHIICGILFAASVIFSFFNFAMITVPILFLASEYIIFGTEFKKQGYIERYLKRAFKRLNERNGRLDETK